MFTREHEEADDVGPSINPQAEANDSGPSMYDISMEEDPCMNRKADNAAPSMYDMSMTHEDFYVFRKMLDPNSWINRKAVDCGFMYDIFMEDEDLYVFREMHDTKPSMNGEATSLVVETVNAESIPAKAPEPMSDEEQASDSENKSSPTASTSSPSSESSVSEHDVQPAADSFPYEEFRRTFPTIFADEPRPLQNSLTSTTASGLIGNSYAWSRGRKKAYPMMFDIFAKATKEELSKFAAAPLATNPMQLEDTQDHTQGVSENVPKVCTEQLTVKDSDRPCTPPPVVLNLPSNKDNGKVGSSLLSPTFNAPRQFHFTQDEQFTSPIKTPFARPSSHTPSKAIGYSRGFDFSLMAVPPLARSTDDEQASSPLKAASARPATPTPRKSRYSKYFASYLSPIEASPLSPLVLGADHTLFVPSFAMTLFTSLKGNSTYIFDEAVDVFTDPSTPKAVTLMPIPQIEEPELELEPSALVKVEVLPEVEEDIKVEEEAEAEEDSDDEDDSDYEPDSDESECEEEYEEDEEELEVEKEPELSVLVNVEDPASGSSDSTEGVSKSDIGSDTTLITSATTEATEEVEIVLKNDNINQEDKIVQELEPNQEPESIQQTPVSEEVEVVEETDAIGNIQALTNPEPEAKPEAPEEEGKWTAVGVLATVGAAFFVAGSLNIFPKTTIIAALGAALFLTGRSL
jgi:hypothetical protein